MGFRVEVVRNWNRFYTLRTDWDVLLTSSRADTVFLTWEWVSSWSMIVRNAVKPFVIVVRDNNNRLVGLAPFYLTALVLLKTVKYRTLRIMADVNTGSEYPGWIVTRESEIEILRLIARTLNQYRKRWDCIWMPKCAGWTGAFDMLDQVFQDESLYCNVRFNSFSAFELPEDFETYLKNLSHNRRSQLRRQMKRILGRPGVAIVRCQEIDELPIFLEALFDLHYQRWSMRGEQGTFRRKPSEALFYREFAIHALQKGWLWLFGLKEDGEFKAIQLGYCYNGSYHQMQEGFEPDYVPGVGNVLRAKVIEACIHNNIKTYDFLGEMTAHKRHWLAQERAGYDLFVGHHSVKNSILFNTRIWPSGRFLCPTDVASQVDTVV